MARWTALGDGDRRGVARPFVLERFPARSGCVFLCGAVCGLRVRLGCLWCLRFLCLCLCFFIVVGLVRLRVRPNE